MLIEAYRFRKRRRPAPMVSTVALEIMQMLESVPQLPSHTHRNLTAPSYSSIVYPPQRSAEAGDAHQDP